MLGRDRFLTQVADKPVAADGVTLDALLGEMSATFGASDAAVDAEVHEGG